MGKFVLDQKKTHHLMVATVTGVAPYVSILRTQKIRLEKEKENPHRFLVLQGASYPKELEGYQEELTQLSQETDWFTYIPTISRPWEATEWKGETGRVDDLVRKYSDSLGFTHKNSVAYVCGHPDMIEHVKGMLSRARFDKEQLKEEKYFQIR